MLKGQNFIRFLKPAEMMAHMVSSCQIPSTQLLPHQKWPQDLQKKFSTGNTTISCFSIVPKMASFYSLQDSVLSGMSVYNPSITFARHKSRKRQQDSDEEFDSDLDDNLDEDDFEAPPQFKVLTIHAPSLRTDAVLSNSLNISRNRLEELFFSSCLLFNGLKLSKKGIKMDEGDYVDVIMDKLEDQVKVKRVKLLRISSQKTTTDKYILKVRVWKAPFLLDYKRVRDTRS